MLDVWAISLIIILYLLYLRHLKSKSHTGTLPPLYVLVAFVLPLALAKTLLRNFSSLQFSDIYRIVADTKEPTTLRGAATLIAALQQVAELNPNSVLFILLLLYTVLQTFCLPGTIGINVVCGALYGMKVATPLCILAGTMGACSCYGLSSLVGIALASRVDNLITKGKGIAKFQQKLEENKDDLLNFFVFLRVSPLLPNWLINLASPVLGVSFRVYAIGTAVGIAPQTFIAVRIGSMLGALGAAGPEAVGNGKIL
eukprot:PhF_6_TR4207/c0_g1_i1/m.5670